jgi:hypothetical protein
MTALISLSAAILILILSASLQAWRKSARQRRLKELELRPNCLLTRYPIAFLSRSRSLFRVFDLWRDIPYFLREHGYEILLVEPKEGIEFLNQLTEKTHLIADRSMESLIEQIADIKHERVASLTLVLKAAKANQTKTRLSIHDLKPRASAIEIFELGTGTSAPIPVSASASTSTFVSMKNGMIEMKFLDLAISLAERDAMSSDERVRF